MNPDQKPEESTPNEETSETTLGPELNSSSDPVSSSAEVGMPSNQDGDSTAVEPAPPSESIDPQPAAPGVAPDPASPADSPVVPSTDEPQLALPAQTDPGKTLGIVGFVLAFFVALAGLIVSIIALHKSKSAGHHNNLALAGIIISVVNMLVSSIIFVVVLGAMLTSFSFS